MRGGTGLKRAGSAQEAGNDGAGRYLTVGEAAAYLAVSRRWMYRESGRHGIPRYYFGGNLRFSTTELDRWVQQQKTL
ncbi:helix-turn-helix domain-containing protein [Streptomyces sp. NPDC056716]|uniref:helix-turn-helix domain-containing protein n=1 Tax=unclassified Streptomyces TaxID=2593676 RepID=UPI0036B29CA6